MNAFAVRITFADSSRLGFHTWAYYEKDELFVGASSRFVHFFKAANINSFDLATQFRDAIVAREHKRGHLDFEAEVVKSLSNHDGWVESVEKDSNAVRAYLEKHRYPKPGTDQVPPVRSGWVIRINHEKLPGFPYLLSMVKDRIASTPDIDRAKCYKTHHYAQKALAKLNEIPNFSAVAIPIEQAKS